MRAALDSGSLRVVADVRPLGTLGQIDEIGDSDRIVVSGIIRQAAGDLTFEDPVTGSKTLAQLAAGGGGLGGTTGAVDNAILRADGTGGSTVQAGSPAALTDAGLLTGVIGTRFTPQASNPGGDNETVWVGTDGELYYGYAPLATTYDLTNTTYITPPALTTSVNDYTPANWDSATHVRQGATADVSITGFGTSTPPGVQDKIILNISAFIITLVHNSGLSLSDNRIRCPDGVDLQIPPNGAVQICEEPSPGPIWRVVAVGSIRGVTGSVDNRVLRADGTGGARLQASPVTIDDAGAVTGVSSLTASGTLSGSNLSGTNTGDQTVTLTGDVTGTGTGSFAATIAGNAVTYAKMQDVSAASRVIGRGSAAGAGDPQELTLGTGLSMSGTVLSSPDQTITLTGDVTGSGTGSFAATIAADAVTYAKMQNVSAASRLLGRGDSGSGDVQELTLGTNLSITGTTLNASGSSPSYTVISPASIGANQNNYAPTGWSTADIVRLAGSGNFDITGFDATATTPRKLLWNVTTANTFTLKHESGSSTAANRLVGPYDEDLKLAPDGAIVIHYDSTTARWRAVSDAKRPPMLLSQARRTAGALISSVAFIGFDSEVYAALGEYWTFDAAGTWTCQKAHTALVHATMTWHAATSGVGSLVLDLRKNASTVLQEQRSSAEQSADNYITQFIEVAHDFVATDTLRLYATNFGGSPTTVANMMILSIFHVKG